MHKKIEYATVIHDWDAKHRRHHGSLAEACRFLKTLAKHSGGTLRLKGRGVNMRAEAADRTAVYYCIARIK